MNSPSMAFRITCAATFLAASIVISFAQSASAPLSSEPPQPFAPLERWKETVLAGDASGLKLLYSSNPVAHIQTASGAVDVDAEVRYWIGMKARGITIEMVQSVSPQPGSQQITFQAEVRSASSSPEITVYITEAQLWQQQNQEWRLVTARRTDPTRLQQPSERKTIYAAKADAQAEIKKALEEAGKANKRVLVIFGANWSYDCHVLELAFRRPDIAPVLEASYLVVNVDVGQGEKNQDLMQRYDVPMERGIPAAAVLDAAGKVLYSQKKGEFAKARSLGPGDVLDFLNRWRPGT